MRSLPTYQDPDFIDLGYRLWLNPKTRELRHESQGLGINLPDPLPGFNQVGRILWTGVSLPQDQWGRIKKALTKKPEPLVGWRALVFEHTLRTFPGMCDPAILRNQIGLRSASLGPGDEQSLQHELTKNPDWFKHLSITVGVQLKVKPDDREGLIVGYQLVTVWGEVKQFWTWNLNTGWELCK